MDEILGCEMSDLMSSLLVGQLLLLLLLLFSFELELTFVSFLYSRLQGMTNVILQAIKRDIVRNGNEVDSGIMLVTEIYLQVVTVDHLEECPLTFIEVVVRAVVLFSHVFEGYS